MHWADEAKLARIAAIREPPHSPPHGARWPSPGGRSQWDPTIRCIACWGGFPADAEPSVSNLKPLSLEAVTALAGPAKDPQSVFALTGGDSVLRHPRVLCAGNATVPATVRNAILAQRLGAAGPDAPRARLRLGNPVEGGGIELLRAHISLVTDDAVKAVKKGLLTRNGRALGFRHELARLAVLESLAAAACAGDAPRGANDTGSRSRRSQVFLRATGTPRRRRRNASAVQRFAPQATQQAAAVARTSRGGLGAIAPPSQWPGPRQ